MARVVITSENVSLLVILITWFLCVVSIFSMVLRGATKVIFKRSIKADDYSSLSSLLLGTAQSIAVTVRASNGLGKHVTALSAAQISVYSKSTYSANIMYLSSMCLSELSVVLYLWNITPIRQDRHTLFGLGSCTIIWTVIGVIVSLTECRPPAPWDYFQGHCIDRHIWWNCVEVMHILINFALIVLPVWIILKVRVSLLRKFSIGLVFGLRATVGIASVCKLVYWNRARHSHDLTFDIWPVALCTQTIQSMSIISYCFLYLKPLLKTLESGVIRSDDFRRRGQMNSGGLYNITTISSGKQSRKERRKLATLTWTDNNDTIVPLENAVGWDTTSQSSRARIMETRSFTVESSVAGGDPESSIGLAA